MTPASYEKEDGSPAVPAHAETAGKAALKRVKLFRKSSNLVTPDHRGDVEDLCWNDLNLGRLLDEGTFSCVYEATLRRDCVQPAPQYAVKCLKQNVTAQEDSFVTGAVDLALEAQILAKLMHPNIIRLHGSTAGCVSESFQEGAGYFLVMDLMVDTLDKRLIRWKREKLSSRFSIRSSNAGEKRQRQLDRLEHVALGVAGGLAYLHSRNVLYRDLKTQNIGFDEHGVVRIFDFGLAREVNTDGQLRHMTGNAGTPRYMAPEVARNETYGFGSDVYSFAILLWEILTLGKPFESIKSLSQFNEEVVRGKLRPPLKKVSSPQLKALLEQSWDDDQAKRPDFDTVRDIIRQDLADAAAEEPTPKSGFFARASSSISNLSYHGDSSTSATSSRGSANTMGQQHISERLVPRLLSSLSMGSDVADAPVRQSGSWFQRKILRQSPLDLSSRSSHLRMYDLGRRDSFNSQNSNCSGNSRRLSGVSERSKASMADALAAESKSNKQVLRQLKARPA